MTKTEGDNQPGMRRILAFSGRYPDGIDKKALGQLEQEFPQIFGSVSGKIFHATGSKAGWGVFKSAESEED